MDTKELWKPVVGFEEWYEVSDQGRVRTTGAERERSDGTKFRLPAKVMSPSSSPKGGYKRVILYRPGSKPKTALIHREVLRAFDREPYEGEQALHNDGDTSNNSRGNLRWGTASDNMYDKSGHGTDHNRNKEVCPVGHKLQEPNLRQQKKKLGYRCCKSCHQARSDIFNGSQLTFQQASDTRYYMNLNGLRYPFGKRKESEYEMWRLANEQKLG